MDGLPDREACRDEFRILMNSKKANIPHNEEELEEYIHALYGDYDLKEELMKELWCEEVVDYLMVTFDEDDIDDMIFTMKAFDEYKVCPIRAIASNCNEDINMSIRVGDKIAEIYLRNSMEDEYRATKFVFDDARRREAPYREIEASLPE